MSISTEKQAHITLPTGMKGILFDFDDTMYAWEEVIRHWATAFTRKHNISDDHAIVDHIVDLLVTVDYHGSTPRIELFRFLQQEYPAFDTALEDLQQHYQEELLSSMIARPDAGAYPLLHALHANHIPFGIITNGDASWQRRKVEAYGIHKLTPHIFVSGAFGAHKPAPSIFQAAAKALELPPEEILFVGDHPIYDIWGAHRVGMHTAWIDRFYPWPRHLPRSIAEITVHSLAELCKLFEVE